VDLSRFNWQNGGGVEWKARLRRLSPAFFEWRGEASGPIWVGLVLLATLIWPWPYVGFGWPLLERAVPIMWLVAAGVVLLAARVAKTSWPLALLLVWAALRGMYHHFPLRTLQVLLLFLMAALLYAAARELPDRWARRVAVVFLIGVGFEFLLGGFNAMRIYPWMGWISPEHVSKPMGMLTHPNYWGSFMALGLPLAWAFLGVPAAALVFILILKTISGGPVISAAVGIAVMAWPLFNRWVRGLVVAVGAGSVGVVMTLHEWRLSGRREVWEVALPEILRWPVLGQGLGQWRQWAEDYNSGIGKFFATLQAHNEPFQLWFELGLIGLVIAGLWVVQGFLAARVVWRAAPAAVLPGPVWQWGRAPLERAWVAVLAVAFVNMWGSPVFHLMPQAALILFALARVQADAAALGPAADLPGRAERPKRKAKEPRRAYAEERG